LCWNGNNTLTAPTDDMHGNGMTRNPWLDQHYSISIAAYSVSRTLEIYRKRVSRRPSAVVAERPIDRWISGSANRNRHVLER
jgi:hypothetical protein